MALPTSQGATGAPGSVAAAISPVSCCEGYRNTANRAANQMENLPRHRIEIRCLASAIHSNFCPPTGPSPRAATVTIWPRRPQYRFRHSSAYCKQGPASRLSLENYFPSDSFDASLFATRETYPAPSLSGCARARQGFCSPRPAGPRTLLARIRSRSRYFSQNLSRDMPRLAKRGELP
jgi:hypothetical protein